MTATIGLSLAAGVAVGAANFYLISRIVRMFVASAEGGGRPRGLRIFFWIVAKIALLAAIIVLIVKIGHARPLAFLAGFTLSLGGIILCMSLRGSGSSPTK